MSSSRAWRSDSGTVCFKTIYHVGIEERGQEPSVGAMRPFYHSIADWDILTGKNGISENYFCLLLFVPGSTYASLEDFFM
jgi:hypothetical protein